MKCSPENETILLVLRSFLGDRPIDPDGRYPWARLSWEAVLAVAKHHGLIPIFYHTLARQGLRERIPSKVAEELQEGYLGSTAHTLFYEEFFKTLFPSFQEAGIPFVLIKGPSMAYEFYHPVEMRPYSDIDLVIQDRDYERVKSVLLKLGMEVTHPEREEIRRTYFNSVPFSKPGQETIFLDLHWETLMISWNRQPFLKGREVWEQVRWISVLDLRLPVLQPQMLIPYLCLHLALHHQFGNLLTLCDLDLAIRKYGGEVDWDRILQQAIDLKIKKPVYYSLRLVSTLLATPVPISILESLRSSRVEEAVLPFEFLIFRRRPLQVHLERLIKFMLIDDLKGKKKSLFAFYGQRGREDG
jgi:hypothetical protein